MEDSLTCRHSEKPLAKANSEGQQRRKSFAKIAMLEVS